MQRLAKTLGTVGLLAIVIVSCAPKSPDLSPTAQRAFTANEIAIRVGEFQNATIAASDAKQIPEPVARQIVTWTVSALETLRTTPQGWDVTIRNGWIAIRPQVKQIPLLGGWATAIDIILGVQ